MMYLLVTQMEYTLPPIQCSSRMHSNESKSQIYGEEKNSLNDVQMDISVSLNDVQMDISVSLNDVQMDMSE